jgi:hypothetical protein
VITDETKAETFFGMMWPVVKSFRSISSKMNKETIEEKSDNVLENFLLQAKLDTDI